MDARQVSVEIVCSLVSLQKQICKITEPLSKHFFPVVQKITTLTGLSDAQTRCLFNLPANQYKPRNTYFPNSIDIYALIDKCPDLYK